MCPSLGGSDEERRSRPVGGPRLGAYKRLRDDLHTGGASACAACTARRYVASDATTMSDINALADWLHDLRSRKVTVLERLFQCGAVSECTGHIV